MDKPKIAFKLRMNDYSGIATLASAVLQSMDMNPNFINPEPGLAVLQTATNELNDAITGWGTPGHRGSHADFVYLQVKMREVCNLLTTLASWCMHTVDPDLSYEEQQSILLSSGFGLRKQRSPQGKLQAVSDPRRMFAYNLSLQQVKLKWSKPQGVATGTNVKNYKIFRNTKVDFYTAVYVGTSTSTSYIDMPGTGLWYYWIVACNTVGDGVESREVEAGVPLSSF